MKLPTYQSHKRVEAFKIELIVTGEDGGKLVPEDATLDKIHVTKEYMDKHEPQVGGYYVRYADGYESWSPAEAFEDGYAQIDSIAEAGAGELERTDGYEMMAIRVIGSGAGIVRLSETKGATPVDSEKVRDMRRLKLLAVGFINETEHVGNDGRATAIARTKMQEACFYAMHSVTAPQST